MKKINQVSQDQPVKTNLRNLNAENDVRETEDASLPDKEYAFGEDNTDNEEYHDADDDLGGDLFDIFDHNSEEQ